MLLQTQRSLPVRRQRIEAVERTGAGSIEAAAKVLEADTSRKGTRDSSIPARTRTQRQRHSHSTVVGTTTAVVAELSSTSTRTSTS